MEIAIIIPARYGSSRLPGKPLATIAGISMLERTYQVALKAIQQVPDTLCVIATDDVRIEAHAKTFDAPTVLTSQSCPTGSNRVLEACDNLGIKPDIIVNLQGDEPLLPPNFISALIESMQKDPAIEVITPVTQLSWAELDRLRQHKINNPFSGTTAAINSDGRALWFSKHIIPAIRKENELRATRALSPVYRHIGLYAYSYQALKTYDELSEGHYETLEGLEQLRFLEAGIPIQTTTVDYGDWPSMSGVDTADDLKLAEQLLDTHGELIHA